MQALREKSKSTAIVSASVLRVRAVGTPATRAGAMHAVPHLRGDLLVVRGDRHTCRGAAGQAKNALRAQDRKDMAAEGTGEGGALGSIARTCVPGARQIWERPPLRRRNLGASSAKLSKTAKNSVRARIGGVLGGEAGCTLGLDVPSKAYVERAAVQLEERAGAPTASSWGAAAKSPPKPRPSEQSLI